MTQKLKPGLGELLRHLSELVERGAEKAYGVDALNYRPRYTPVMRALADGGCAINEITARLSITQGAVSQTVKLMIADGLVRRTPGSDARRSIVCLTGRGQGVLRDLQPRWRAIFDAIQGLEDEIDVPLRGNLSAAIAALQRLDFAQRIAVAKRCDERAPGTIEPRLPTASHGYFQQGGEAYALSRPTYPPELAQQLAGSCAERLLALDVGCGSGQLSALLADHFDQVIATDVSADQLDHAQQRPNILYRQEAAENMSAASDSADLIVAAQAAHWFDLPRFYRECRRVGKPGAVIALASYGVPYLEGPLNARLQQFYWQQTAQFWPAGRHHVETGYAELPFPFSHWPSPALFIHRDWSIDQLLGYMQTWSAYRRALDAGRREIFERFGEQLTAVWGEPGSLQRITWPISMRIGRV